jgi:hypothetical protein
MLYSIVENTPLPPPPPLRGGNISWWHLGDKNVKRERKFERKRKGRKRIKGNLNWVKYFVEKRTK